MMESVTALQSSLILNIDINLIQKLTFSIHYSDLDQAMIY